MAFDTLAPSYDKEFTHTPIGQILRNRVHQRLLSHFKAGDSVLELGCGTGEDALFLAEQGINITATDASEGMLAIARQKTAHLQNVKLLQFAIPDDTISSTGRSYNREYHKLDIVNIDESASAKETQATNNHQESQFYQETKIGGFTGAFSNFGALNCLGRWDILAGVLATRVQKGGIVGLGIMSPYCLWEFSWHALHWKWNIALRRLRGSEFEGIHITYPTVQRITQDFSPYFRRVHLMPLGLFLPTSALFDVVQKRPKLMQTLVKLENRFGNISQLALLADHYWIEFERV